MILLRDEIVTFWIPSPLSSTRKQMWNPWSRGGGGQVCTAETKPVLICKLYLRFLLCPAFIVSYTWYFDTESTFVVICLQHKKLWILLYEKWAFILVLFKINMILSMLDLLHIFKLVKYLILYKFLFLHIVFFTVIIKINWAIFYRLKPSRANQSIFISRKRTYKKQSFFPRDLRLSTGSIQTP